MQLSSKAKRIAELEKESRETSSTKSSSLSFDPFGKDQKEATDPNYFIGQEDDKYIRAIKKIGE